MSRRLAEGLSLPGRIQPTDASLATQVILWKLVVGILKAFAEEGIIGPTAQTISTT